MKVSLAPVVNKIKANCSKKRAYTINGLEDALKHIDEKINEYISHIEDDSTADSEKEEFKKKLELIKQRKVNYSDLKDKMINENISEYCATDPDTGYYKTDDLLALNNNNIKALVPKPKTTSSSGDSDFSKCSFIYDEQKDIYNGDIIYQLRYIVSPFFTFLYFFSLFCSFFMFFLIIRKF